MNEPLSVVHLISNAGPLVKGVMLLLFLASVLSWAVIVQRVLFYAREKRSMDQFEDQFWSGMDLGQLFRQGHERAESGKMSGMESIFRAGFREFSRLRQQAGVDPDAVMEGTQRAMRVATLLEEQKLNRYLSFLATVGSTSPYVGLFGTVWGIMNSFRGLANVQQATLATVAPGISEALIATAMGLFAAIPAVIAYNRFLADVDVLIGRLDVFTDEFSSILHRQAHARRGGHASHDDEAEDEE
ncbi:MAG: protein TolQ [Gammaproteobacteria bacterium]|nr:MAG: protein TolQ [Gammaproteobacteria bacterium]